MRVTNANMYRRHASAVNDVHSKLNKAMNKISTGAAYETAADNPLAYYQGQKMDRQFQDAESKLTLMTDVSNRIHQQELGARTIQSILSSARNDDVEYILNGTNIEDNTTVGTTYSSLLQRQQSVVSALNSQYEDFYIYGGNDLTTSPFKMSADGMKLTYNHTFPGEGALTTIVLEMEGGKDAATGKLSYGFHVNLDESYNGETGTRERFTSETEALRRIQQAMTEHGYMDLGYGTIDETSTLLDTFTGGFNALSGISTMEAANFKKADGSFDPDALLASLNHSAAGLIGQAIASTKDYIDGNATQAEYSGYLRPLMDEMTNAGHDISTIYSDLGNKYSLIQTTKTNLEELRVGLIQEYKDKLGADPYQAITEMYSYQFSYAASLKLSSKIMESSLFNFIS